MNLAMRMQSKTKQEEMLLLQSPGSICSNFLLLLKGFICDWDGDLHNDGLAASPPELWEERMNVLFKASVALTLTQPGCPSTTEGCEQGDASQNLLGQDLTAGDTLSMTRMGCVPFPAHAGLIPCC